MPDAKKEQDIHYVSKMEFNWLKKYLVLCLGDVLFDIANPQPYTDDLLFINRTSGNDVAYRVKEKEKKNTRRREKNYRNY